MDEGYAAVEADRWTGWVAFAGIMMIIGGCLQGIYGTLAIVNDTWVVWTNTATMYLDISQWGWIHLIWGVIMVVAGLGVLGGNIFARLLGVILAAIAAIVNFMFIPVYPLWSIVVVVISIVVIYALVAHGKVMKEA